MQSLFPSTEEPIIRENALVLTRFCRRMFSCQHCTCVFHRISHPFNAYSLTGSVMMVSRSVCKGHSLAKTHALSLRLQRINSCPFMTSIVVDEVITDT